MRKVLFILISILVIFSLTACKEPVPENIEYDLKMVNDFIETVDFVERDDYTRRCTEAATDIPLTKTVKILDKEYVLNYEHTRMSDEGVKDEKKYHCYSYKSYKEKIDAEAHFDAETGELVSFFDHTYHLRDEKTLTSDKAVELAEKAVKSLYGKKALKGYELFCIEEYKDAIVVGYAKFFNGIRSTDEIVIYLDLSGCVYHIRSNEFGGYDGIENEITKERIEAAEKHLLSQLPEGFELSERKRLVKNYSTNKIYLRAYANGYSFYINLY